MTQVHLNRALVLENLLRVPDGAGGFSESWSPLGTLWAQVRATGGSEGETDHAKLSQVSYSITVRAAPHGAPSRPKPDQRLIEGSRIFRILAVTERDPTGKYLELRTIEEVAS
ncbi:MAG: head-tail adaptor protein [Pseudomonadota bacterium]